MDEKKVVVELTESEAIWARYALSSTRLSLLNDRSASDALESARSKVVEALEGLVWT